MPTRRTREQLWNTTGSGIVFPGGISSELSLSSSLTYLQIKNKAMAIEQLYTNNRLPLPPTCDLAHLICDAKTLSDSWLMNRVDNMDTTLLFRVSFLDRIADAILPLSDVPERARYLTQMTSSSLDLQQRNRSLAKDILWELELWSVLRKRSLDAILCEPPDIVVTFEESKIGIACKKLYSEENVEKVLSEGVAQIEATFDFGILAVNLDDLTLPEQILRAGTQEVMGKFIDNLNLEFLHRHKRHFRKYLASGRLLSALVSTSVLADTYNEKTRFNMARQMTIWAIPGLPPEKEKQLKRFYHLMH